MKAHSGTGPGSERGETLEHIITQMGGKERGAGSHGCPGGYAVQFLPAFCRETVGTSPGGQGVIHKQIDKVLTGKYTAIPAFVGIMALLFFFLTFGVIGAWLSDMMELGIGWFTGICDRGLRPMGSIRWCIHDD